MTSPSRHGRPPGAAISAALMLLLAAGFTPGARAAGSPAGEPVIAQIRFAGNDRTRDRVMLQEMLVHVGDPADPALIERSRQAIMDLELFKSVRADLLPHPDGRTLLITVDEKYYTLPLPVLGRNADGDITYGVELRMDNLRGMNQELKAKYKVKDFADGEISREETSSLDYSYPRIAGGPYEMRVSMNDETRRLDAQRGGEEGLYERRYREARLSVLRWLNRRGPSRGWRFGAGLVAYDIDYEHIDGAPGLFHGGKVLSLRLGANFSDVRNYLFSRAGREYGYQVDIADQALGSDESFVKHELYYRDLARVTDRPHTNLNYQLRFKTANNDLFGEPFYSLGGSDSLRAYDRDTLRGNTLFSANLEFLTPLRVRYPALRGVLFVDAGNAWPDLGDVDPGDIKVAVGGGLRWVVKSFVRFTLSLDAAYAIDDQNAKVYVGTGNTF